jgi:GNAT superfamily N-acetyltransferase
MPTVNIPLTDIEFHPLTSDRWIDLEKLFDPRGACGGCWCMWWKLSRSQFMKQRGEENKKAFKNIVDSGNIPGIVAYLKDQPIGWCAVAPREVYPSLERSRLLKRVDDRSVWSVVCFFVAKQFRHKGLMVRLLGAAVDYVKSNDGAILEGYPIESKSGRMPDPFAYTGVSSAFRKAGFREVLRRSETRPIMRYMIGKTELQKAKNTRPRI